MGVVIALAGCMPATADVQIEDVSVHSGYKESVVTIDTANLGLINAWIHTWPEQLRAEPETNGLVIALHAEGYEVDKEVPASLAPVIRYQRLAPGTSPINLNEHTIQIELPPEIGPADDDRANSAELGWITVELAWHEHNPGANVTMADAPDPDGIAVYTWFAN
jgi:hypothetical protein